MRLILLIWNLFDLLPWWGAVLVLAGLAIGLYALGHYLMHKLFRDAIKAVAQRGVALNDALVNVHSIEPADVPDGLAFDDDAEDEDFDPEIDGNLTAEEADYYWVDATISPVDPQTAWDPSDLTLVAWNFKPSEELEVTDQMGVLHTIEVLRGREFVRCGGGTKTGPQRLRMLFAVTKGLRDVKFGYHFTYFGRATLPENVSAAPATREAVRS